MSDRRLKLKGSFSLRRNDLTTILVHEKDLPKGYVTLEGYLRALLEECWSSAVGIAPPRLHIVNVPAYDADLGEEIKISESVKFYPTNIFIVEADNSSKEYHPEDVAQLIGKSYNVDFRAGEDENSILTFTAHNVTPPRMGEECAGPLASNHWAALTGGVSQMLYKGLDSDSIYNISQLTKDAKALIEAQISPVDGSRVNIDSKILSNLTWRPRTRLATSVVITDAESGKVVFQRSLTWNYVARLIRKLGITSNG